MVTRQAFTLIVAAGTLATILALPVSAQVLTPIAISGGNVAATNVTYAPGAGNGLNINTNNGFIIGKVGQGSNSNATISFPTLTNNGNYTFNAGTGAFDQGLNGSSFLITANVGGATLLSGTFGAGELTGVNTSGSAGVNLVLQSVTYTGGSLFPAGFSTNNGSLSIEFVSPTPIAANAAGIPAFTATDGITFSATRNAVPEPGAVALLSSLAVCGSVFGLRRLRRRK